MRRETGVLRTPGDWPGYFLRGDNALALANTLEVLAGALETGTLKAGDVAQFLRKQADKFREVRAADRDPPEEVELP